jgi:hypothetical protein
MQQMQGDDTSDELIISKIGSAVHAAVAAKDSLHAAIAEAVDASTTFGYELGAEDKRNEIIELFKKTNSSCSEWAISVIEGRHATTKKG